MIHPSGVPVRPLQEADIPAVAAEALAAWRKAIAPLLPLAARGRVKPGTFEWLLRAEQHEVLVALLDDRPAGLVACRIGEDHITDLWVGPAFEGRGAGRALLSAMETRIRRRGFRAASIEVLAGNQRALQLYLHEGYEQRWRKVRDDRFLRTALDKIGLRKLLP